MSKLTEIERVIRFFNDKPYAIKMGAKTIGERINVDPKIVDFVRKNKFSKKPTTVDRKSKILIVDIETSPLKAYVWSRWKQNIYLEQTLSEWFMISWAAKWLGENTIMSNVLTQMEAIMEDDERITGSLWNLLNEADIVIAHNGKKFDIPKMNSRFIIHGFPPPAPYKQIDTKEVAARQFGFSSNKLDALAGYFNIRHKDETSFELWVGCLDGDKDALNKMEKYNKGDVEILEQVYLRLRPYIKGHPNLGLYMEDSCTVCPTCGSHKVEPIDKEFAYTPSSKYSLMRCSNCGATSRMSTNLYPKDKRNNLARSV